MPNDSDSYKPKFKTGDVVVTTNSNKVPVGTFGIVVGMSRLYPDKFMGKAKYDVEHTGTIYGRKGGYSDEDLELTTIREILMSISNK